MKMPRASGVLLHITSLPGPHGSGDFGSEARRFVDWLAEADQQLWQVLPLTSIGSGNSPYASPSAFAVNPLLIDLQALEHCGWLEKDGGIEGAFPEDRVAFERVIPYRMRRLQMAWRGFESICTAAEQKEFSDFCTQQAFWINDYALFMSLHAHLETHSWLEWPAALARREPDALDEALAAHAEAVSFWKFCQWYGHRQWRGLKRYANERGVSIVGDMPIFVAHNSADVWTHPELFDLDEMGRSRAVAGVPPDVFSPDGQRWGNPLYHWDVHAATGFKWWIQRFAATLAQVDMVRIDHFAGFVCYWEVPAHQPTAREGRWRPAPGQALFEALTAALGPLPAIAEDLGAADPEVFVLRTRFGMPGMCILQFAFDGEESLFLPHAHHHDMVIYTGTHDNDTTCGWWDKTTEDAREFTCRYLGMDGSEIHWQLIRAASASVGKIAIHPLQDVLGLGTEARMNFPGHASGEWSWRVAAGQLMTSHAQRLAEVTRLYCRHKRRSSDVPG
ncbi:MAG: malQ [Rhodocyclales bacterium]|nr:malQ [Rhodocyclales bacterium]